MHIILDIVLVLIIVAICSNGYIRGLMISLFNMVSSMIALVLAFILSPALASFFRILPVYDWIRNPIFDNLMTKSTEMGLSTAEEFVNSMFLPPLASDQVIYQAGEVSGQAEIAGTISDIVTMFILQVIAAVIIFITVKLLLLFAKKIIQKISRIPVIRQIDKAGGLLVGAAEAFFILTIAGALLTLFSGSVDAGIITAVENSFIARFFYNDNLLLAILSGNIKLR